MKQDNTMGEPNDVLFSLTLRKRFVFRVGVFLFALIMIELLGQILYWGLDTYQTSAQAARPDTDAQLRGCNHPNEATCPKQPYQQDLGNVTITNPYSYTRLLPGYNGFWISTNQQGFRGPFEFESPKPDDVYRIVILGGSAVFGAGVHDDETIPFYLQTLLNDQTDQPVEVINAGFIGYNSTMELTLVAVHIIDLEPDLVVIYDGYNDLFYGLSPKWVEDYTPSTLNQIQLLTELQNPSVEPQQEVERVPFIYTPFGSFVINQLAIGRLTHATIYNLKNRLMSEIAERVEPESAPDPADSLSIHPQAIDVYEKNLQRIIILLQGYQIDMMLVYQPSMSAGEKVFTEEEQGYVRYSRQEGYYDLLTEFYPDGVSMMSHVGQEYDIPFYDFTGIFDDEPGWMYLDNVHLHPDGNRMVAEQLADIIMDQFMSVSKTLP